MVDSLTRAPANRRMMTGNAAAAWGARLAGVDYVPAFPITPQTEIIELLSEWFETGAIRGRFVTLDSEHSMLTAAGAAAATGVRVFTATSSQGLVYGLEVLYTIAGWRVPLVLVNVSRGLSAPITLGPDHNDVLAARDTGFVQLHAETCQEVLDFILLAYRIAESPEVSTPVLVNLDGFQLSFTREPVEAPPAAEAAEFVGKFRALHPGFRRDHPVAHGVATLDGAAYSYFRYQLHRAVENANRVFRESAQDFAQRFGRVYEPLDAYRLDDAEYVLVIIGSYATKAKAAVDRWRERGVRIGLVRPRLIRPFPANELRACLASRRAVGVLDQNLAPGLGGILYHEVAGTLAGTLAGGLAGAPANASAGIQAGQISTAPCHIPALRSFIGGLGGKDISDGEWDYVFEQLAQAQPGSSCDGACLLMSEAELQGVRRSIAVAGKGGP
jgi:pyruvate ferredoxin oxidoreductase alpha subunit